MRLLFIAVFLFFAELSEAQRFWLITRDFPGDVKQDILLVNDTTLLVALDHAILLSKNDGNSWDTLFVGANFRTLFLSNTNRIFVGAYSKIYFTDDLVSWDSVSLEIQSYVSQFCEVNNLLYFASSGYFGSSGYRGNGVYRSTSNGETWFATNNGLLSNQNVQFITKDKYNRVLIGVNDNDVSNNAGLYKLNPLLNKWEKIIISFDGQNIIEPQNIRVAFFKGLNYLNNDSILISVDGIAVNVAVSVNLVKHVDDLTNSSNWKLLKVSNSNLWWADQLLCGIFITKNKHWYSSITGSANLGGSMYSTTKGETWLRHQYGLGTDLSGRFNVQKFVENSKGKVFMIQQGDFRIYWTDKSISTGIVESEKRSTILFPNPVSNFESAKISFESQQERSIKIINLSGVVLHEFSSFDSVIELPKLDIGMYIVSVATSTEMYSIKLLVN